MGIITVPWQPKTVFRANFSDYSSNNQVDINYNRVTILLQWRQLLCDTKLQANKIQVMSEHWKPN